MRNNLTPTSLILISFVMAGCMSQTTLVSDKASAGSAASSLSATGGAPNGSTGNLMTPSRGPATLNKTVLAGQQIEIVHLTTVNPDCTPGILGTMRITRQPVNGKATLSQSEVFPNFPAANPRSACNNKKFPGLVLTYTPTPGFTGSDFMAFEMFTHAGGDSNEVKVPITVK